MEVDPHVEGPNEEIPPYATIYFDMTLNELKGGKAKTRLFVDTGSGWVERPEEEYYSYPAYDPETETGDHWENHIYVYLDPPDGGGIRGMAKLVFDIEYPDGTTDTVEADPRPFHKGNFARINTDYGNGGYDYDYDYDAESETSRYIFSFDVILDTSLVDPSRVTAENNEIWLAEPWTYYYTSDITHYIGDDGLSHMRFVYTSEERFPSGEYSFSPEVEFQEDDYNSWRQFDLYLYYVFVAPD